MGCIEMVKGSELFSLFSNLQDLLNLVPFSVFLLEYLLCFFRLGSLSLQMPIYKELSVGLRYDVQVLYVPDAKCVKVSE